MEKVKQQIPFSGKTNNTNLLFVLTSSSAAPVIHSTNQLTKKSEKPTAEPLIHLLWENSIQFNTFGCHWRRSTLSSGMKRIIENSFEFFIVLYLFPATIRNSECGVWNVK